MQEEGRILSCQLSEILLGLFLITNIHLVILGLGPALAGFHVHFSYRLAAIAFDAGNHRGGVRAQPIVNRESIVVVIVSDTHADFFISCVIMENR